MSDQRAAAVFTDPPYNVPIYGHACRRRNSPHRVSQKPTCGNFHHIGNEKRAYGKRRNAGSKVLRKVNSLWPNPRLLIALHSPNSLLETGLRMCPREKEPGQWLPSRQQSVLCSPVCLGIIAKYGHVSRISGEIGADFLCSPDCVAERAGFEPSVQFCRAKPRYIRKLQIAKPYQRISSKTRHQIFAISPVSIRRPFGHERRTPGDSVAKSGHCARPHAARLGSHVTACLACSHKTESFSGGRNYLRRDF